MKNDHSVEKIEIKPFLKWAGGKRWLIAKHDELLPDNFRNYYEPFLGSGAVFFYLQPGKSVLADVNQELIDTYSAIKQDWQRVQDCLMTHHRNHSTEYFYRLRQQKPRTDHTKAARLIYLNRTCWNGLYRVNLQGTFNVPIGTKVNVISDEDRYDQTSMLLKNANLLRSDFEAVVDKAGQNDFLFVDPPYTVKHNYNGFIKYNENLFAWEDQVRLRDALVRAAARGARFLMTNASHRSVKALYRDYFQMIVVERSSVISGSNSGRGTYEELLVHHGI
ncbi:Dam family site-specific DNA-(adenine-N6)-methyltransferase [Polaromonas sp. A23]|uniref:DNA adenine methylase n=1 Tax=Polaromonas sp. A23 TaxID=1944133 RepID=UPI000985D8F9|nr:Dam family site-specific DNA-(adenine-N6)-methyltransferase [Polaromonas sp. A23]OOG44193.1 DNA methyltransferase [Polaromonas sp. A23]